MHPLDHMKIARKAVDLYLDRKDSNLARPFDRYRPLVLVGRVVEDSPKVLIATNTRLAKS
jgi:hypothetical protein